MKAILLGANGYIGMHLAMHLQKMNASMSLFDIQETGQPWFNNYQPLDIRYKEAVSKLDTDVDFIFFFSGLTGTGAAFNQYEQYIDVNEKGLLHLLDHMRSEKSKAQIVFPSTRLIYKGKKNQPIEEDDEKECKTIYALNKFFSETILKQYAEYFGIHHTIFRICVPYGNEISNNYSYGTIGFFLKKALAGEDISLYGTGEQRRTFTNVSDLVSAILASIQQPEAVNQTFNIGGENFSLREVADMIAAKYKIGVKLAPWPPLELLIESGDTVFNAEKIEKMMNRKLFTSKLSDWISNL